VQDLMYKLLKSGFLRKVILIGQMCWPKQHRLNYNPLMEWFISTSFSCWGNSMCFEIFTTGFQRIHPVAVIT